MGTEKNELPNKSGGLAGLAVSRSLLGKSLLQGKPFSAKSESLPKKSVLLSSVAPTLGIKVSETAASNLLQRPPVGGLAKSTAIAQFRSTRLGEAALASSGAGRIGSSRYEGVSTSGHRFDSAGFHARDLTSFRGRIGPSESRRPSPKIDQGLGIGTSLYGADVARLSSHGNDSRYNGPDVGRYDSIAGQKPDGYGSSDYGGYGVIHRGGEYGSVISRDQSSDGFSSSGPFDPYKKDLYQDSRPYARNEKVETVDVGGSDLYDRYTSYDDSFVEDLDWLRRLIREESAFSSTAYRALNFVICQQNRQIKVLTERVAELQAKFEEKEFFLIKERREKATLRRRLEVIRKLRFGEKLQMEDDLRLAERKMERDMEEILQKKMHPGEPCQPQKSQGNSFDNTRDQLDADGNFGGFGTLGNVASRSAIPLSTSVSPASRKLFLSGSSGSFDISTSTSMGKSGGMGFSSSMTPASRIGSRSILARSSILSMKSKPFGSMYGGSEMSSVGGVLQSRKLPASSRFLSRTLIPKKASATRLGVDQNGATSVNRSINSSSLLGTIERHGSRQRSL